MGLLLTPLVNSGNSENGGEGRQGWPLHKKISKPTEREQGWVISVRELEEWEVDRV